jgi:hypothetical protein
MHRRDMLRLSTLSLAGYIHKHTALHAFLPSDVSMQGCCCT